MAIDFDLSRALFLTYVGVGAAFLVLGSLVIFTALIGWWGNRRLRKARERAEAETTAQSAEPAIEAASEAGTLPADPHLAAAIGTAVALAVDAYRSGQVGETPPLAETIERDGGWREQGRIAAFDARRHRERQ